MTKIPHRSAQLKPGRVPKNVALLSERSQKYLISFMHYSDDMCEISELEKKKFKACVGAFKRINEANVGFLREQNIDRIPIRGGGEYARLFSKTPTDTEIFEHKIQDTARIFYFTEAHIFYVVAITKNHLK